MGVQVAPCRVRWIGMELGSLVVLPECGVSWWEGLIVQLLCFYI